MSSMVIGKFLTYFSLPTKHKPNAGSLIDYCTQHTVGEVSRVSLWPSDLSLIVINKHS